MRLGLLTNGISCEDRMQQTLKNWLTENDFVFLDEFHISEVSRRADFLILQDNKLINIEAKCINLECMLKQLRDHCMYCDYSFAYIPDYINTPKWFKTELMETGFGLIIFNYKLKVITEVLESHFNQPENKNLKSKIINDFKIELNKRKGKIQNKQQLNINL